MAATICGYDLHLEDMRAEELVVLSQDCRYEPARAELVRRFYPKVNGHVGRLAKHHKLAHQDVEEAQQHGLVVLLNTIDNYDTLQLGRRHGRPFASFLRLVVRSRFFDFLRGLRRYMRRFDFSLQSSAALEGSIEKGTLRGSMLTHCRNGRLAHDRDTETEREERLARLHEVLKRLGEDAQRMLCWLAAGLSIREIATELGVPRHIAQRPRRRFIVTLTAELRRSET